MTDRELMQKALGIMEWISGLESTPLVVKSEFLNALRARLAQPEPKPVAWIVHEDGVRGLRWSHPRSGMLKVEPLYASPPQREWQGLTENEIKHLWYEACQTNLELTSQLIVHLARNIEAKLKERNT
jgi:hypothetical protein